MKRFCVGMLLVLASGQGAGQEANQVWEEYGKRVESSGKVSPLGPDLFGDQVSLSNGALSFSVTDVSLPGNNSLPVEFTRTFTVRSRKGAYLYNDFPLADWEIGLPSISGVFAPDWVSAATSSPNRRCSVTTVGAARPPRVTFSPDAQIEAKDYWQGHQLSLPTGGGEMLLLDSGAPRPTTGGPYYWVTGDQTRIGCLPAIKNWTGGGEGFLAVAPDGTKYWFDWMAQYLEPTLESRSTIYVLGVPKTTTHRQARRKNVLYPTRVEDRFGNWVTYTYTNARQDAVRLTRIQSSDGRRIDVSYDSAGRVGTVTAGARSWQYRYGTVGNVDDSLVSVTLPDASSWTINFTGLLNAAINYMEGPVGEPWRNCVLHPELWGPSSFSGSVKHPSGATGEFTVAIQHHGRTNVPVNCENFTVPNTDKTDDISFWPIYYHGLSLTKKVISGPALDPMSWVYTYSSPRSFYYPSGDSNYPICPAGTDCSIPRCTDDECAGSTTTTVTDPAGQWVRYRYGNSYRYNEGKLLKVETGAGSTVLRTTSHTYDLSQLDHEYPAKWGTSPQMIGGGFTSEYHRPLLHKATVQNGTSFDYRVDGFDAYARPVNVIRSSTGADGDYADPPSGAPTLTVPATSSSDGFVVKWTAVAAATSYRLEQRRDGDSWAQIYSGAALSDVVSGLVNGSYSYRARACNAGGCGSYSAIKSTVVTVPPAFAPTLTAPSTNTSGAFSLSWTAVGTTTSYRLEQRKGSGSWSQIYSGSGLAKSVSGLGTGSYGYRTRACNAGGCSGYSPIKTTVVTRPPATVPTLSGPLSASTNETYTVRWTAVATTTRYELQVSVDGGGWTTPYTGTAVYRAENQRFEGTYAYRVRACNAGGCTAYSPAKSILVYGGGGGPCTGGVCPVPNALPPDEPVAPAVSDEGDA